MADDRVIRAGIPSLRPSASPLAFSHNDERVGYVRGTELRLLNLRRVARAVTKFYAAEMRRHGIRPTQGFGSSETEAAQQRTPHRERPRRVEWTTIREHPLLL